MTSFAFLAVFSSLLPCSCVQQLGARSFRQREAAHRTIQRMGRAALPFLEIAARHPSAEVRRRSAVLLARYEDEIAERESHKVLPSNYPRLPWIVDVSVESEWMMVDRHLTEARKAVPFDRQGPNYEWPQYRIATRLWIKSQLLQRRPLAEIVEDLDRMVQAERDWIQTYGGSYKPAIALPKGYE